MKPFSKHTESHAQSNTQESPSSPSLYDELNVKTLDIRILKLLPGTEEIFCTLSRVSCIPKYPEYTALSYCWGGTSEKKSIWINGLFVSITKNLFEALKVLRQRNISVLWIDAICINQDDAAEKSHQVQRMAQVYRNASQTVAWLGRDNPYPDEVFDVLTLLASRQLSKSCKEEIMLEQPSRSLKAATKVEALNSFVSIPYWERTWIIQELALSRNVVFIWDEQLWDETTIHAAVGSIRWITRLPDKLPDWATMRGVFLAISHFRQKQSSPISMLLSDTTLSKATEQHDKIFAILGLAEEGFKLTPEVDYSKPLNDILRSAMILSFTTVKEETTGTCRPMDLICLGDPTKPKRLSLPSWVIDWKTLWDSSYKWSYQFSSPAHRGLRNKYCACGLMPASIDFSEDDRTMIASGYVFDTIQSLSKASTSIHNDPKTLPPEVTDTPDCTRFGVYGTQISLRNAIWRSLVHDRGEENTIPLRSSEAPAVFEHYFQVCLSEKTLLHPRDLRFSRYLSERIGTMLVFGKTIEDWAQSGKEECFTLEGSSSPSMEDFKYSLAFRNFGRRFMITKKGYVGIAHAQGQMGDSIVLLRGCTMPMILRKCDGGWRVVGEAYVHGIMNGEAWREREEEEMETFYLK
ncbi:hypothetical protein HYFRA_00008814 [Hymenoscyphus fraxineus]|uniref:Heterokaryon incompatibility domain-containing protein n=1 Tax=Hymenoscyphus fraxineus TaxID=746836 RepID=A0A9N9KX34_9HELO|nr:hypothetical protein HYFRA_00008814 [Hymenoscyphus fraxineus]